MRRTASVAVLCVVGLVVAVGVRIWMDVRGSMDDVAERTTVRASGEQRIARPLRTVHDGTVDVADRHDPVAHGSHIGEYLDPEADHVPREWAPKHIGDRLDPDALLEFGANRIVSHIGEHLDPDDDWRRPRHDAPRHLGEPVEPDFPPLAEPSTSHIGERLEPPGGE